MPPNIEGNSGPRKVATIKYGMVIERAAKIANFHTLKPSAKDRLAPKNRVITEVTNRGINVPAVAWIIAIFVPMKPRKSSHSEKPNSIAYALIPGSAESPVFTPTNIGVPIAPNDTGVL